MWSRNSAMSTAISELLPTMLCVVALICVISSIIRFIVPMVVSMSPACLSMVANMSSMYFSFIC